MNSLDSSSFVPALLEEVPEINAVYDEHIDDYDELLEHLFMADVTRYIEKNCSSSTNSDCFERLCSFLNKAFKNGDEKVQEIISLSFLENLSRNEKSYDVIRSRLSSEMRLELSKYS